MLLHDFIRTYQKFVIYETFVMGNHSSESLWPAKLRSMLLLTRRYPFFRKNWRSQTIRQYYISTPLLLSISVI